MDRWQIDELLKLGDALATVDLDSVNVRRVMQRLERSEITPLQAAKTIVSASGLRAEAAIELNLPNRRELNVRYWPLAACHIGDFKSV